MIQSLTRKLPTLPIKHELLHKKTTNATYTPRVRFSPLENTMNE